MEKILLVDDETELLKSLKDYLEKKGFNVTTATSVDDAIEIIEKDTFSFILSDLRMPGKSGAELYVTVRNTAPETRFALMTAYAEEHACKTLKAHGVDILEKPFSLEDLETFLKSKLSKGFKGVMFGLDLTDLIQIISMERKTIALIIKIPGAVGTLYFSNGELINASVDNVTGEEAAYEILAWEGGEFSFKDFNPEKIKREINMPIEGILMEAMRLKDEREKEKQQQNKKKEVAMARKEELDKILQDLVQGSTDVEGVALFTSDGLIVSSHLPVGDLDPVKFGALGATALGLSKRTLEELKKGEFEETIIKGENGYVMLIDISGKAALMAVVTPEANLGMLFVEMRSTADKIEKLF